MTSVGILAGGEVTIVTWVKTIGELSNSLTDKIKNLKENGSSWKNDWFIKIYKRNWVLENI